MRAVFFLGIIMTLIITSVVAQETGVTSPAIHVPKIDTPTGSNPFDVIIYAFNTAGSLLQMLTFQSGVPVWLAFFVLGLSITGIYVAFQMIRGN